MERLYYTELKEEVKRVEQNVSRCQRLFLKTNDHVYKYATKGKTDDLNLAIENKRTCLRLVGVSENVCRRVAEAFVELSILDNPTLYAEIFNLLTISQEVVRNCLGWYRELSEIVDNILLPIRKPVGVTGRNSAAVLLPS